MAPILFKYSKKCQKTELYIMHYLNVKDMLSVVGESHCTVYFDFKSKTVPSRIETTCESVFYMWVIKAFTQLLVNIILI